MRRLLDLLAPPRCGSCGVRTDPPWCPRCAEEVQGLVLRGGCRRCGSVGPRDGHGCWDPDGPVERSVAAFRYTGPVAAAVVTGKTRGAWSLWEPLGRHLATAVAAAGVQVDAVTFVPADPRRARTRGFDHARLLAAPVGRALERPVVTLLRARPGRPDQGTRAPEERHDVPADAFLPVLRPPPSVLLVDDVLTTGATAAAAAAALRRAGAHRVIVAVVGRAGQRALGWSPTIPSSDQRSTPGLPRLDPPPID